MFEQLRGYYEVYKINLNYLQYLYKHNYLVVVGGETEGGGRGYYCGLRNADFGIILIDNKGVVDFGLWIAE